MKRILVVLCLLSTSLAAFAQEDESLRKPRKRQSAQLPPGPDGTLRGKLIKLFNEKEDESAALLLTVLREDDYLNERELKAIEEDRMEPIEGREQEANDVIDVFVRLKSKVPILVAKPGVGKTAIAQRAVQKTVLKLYPDKKAFHDVLDKAEWIQIKPASLMRIMKTNNEIARMKAIDDFFTAVVDIERKLDVNLLTFVDETHSLDKYQIEALLPYLESQGMSVRVLGATNSNKLGLAFKDNEAFLRRIKQIPVVEMDDEKTLELVKRTWIPKAEKEYLVKFGDDSLKRLIRFGMLLNPDGGKFDGAIKAAQDLAIWNLRGAHKALLTQEDLFQFYKEKTRFPVDPFNKSELHTYLTDLETKINGLLIGQSRLVHDVVQQFRDVILGSKKDMAVVGVVGPSGTGKSEIAKLIAKYGFNNPNAYLKIDCNEYQNDDLSAKKLFGAEGGLVTSNERSGILPDFFDDPSQGKFGGVIVFDEAEKAHPKFWQRLMEFFEEGQFRGGDGKIRLAKRHLVIITSNRGDTILFPESMRNLDKARIMKHAESIGEKELKQQFQMRTSGRDEFQIPTSVLNRVDRWTVSVPLHNDDVDQIATNFAARKKAEVEDLFQIKIDLDPAIGHRIGRIDFDPQYGARPIERGLSRFFTALQDKILAAPQSFKDKAFKLTQVMSSKDEGFAKVEVDGENVFDLELPRLELDEPLESTTLAETLLRVRTIIPATIIGQDDAVERVKDVLISYLTTPRKVRPTLGIFLLGLTGVGKTEMAKAIAHAVFGSAERADIIPMGEINSDADFNRIIGSPPGFIGSDQVRDLEKALQNHPEGGVIVLDEATNMGGAIKEVRTAMFKRLYNLFEEGKWTSSATNTTYDLTKYIFVLTGNDGEHLFQGNSDDFLRMQTWKRASKASELHKMLLDKGVPEAFLGRMAETIMMKPLLRKETELITKKLLAPIFDRFRKLGYEMRLSPDFDAAFGKMFFTQSKGARSIRHVANMKTGTLIAESILAAGPELKNADHKWIDVKIEDNILKEPYVRDLDYEAKVELRVRVGTGDKELINLTRPVTAFAAIDKRLSYKQALATAYHEAGHAVTNDPDITGVELKHLTILGSEGNLGFAAYDNDDAPHRYVSTNQTVMDKTLARLFGGQVAMMMSGTDKDAGWGGDIEQARKAAARYVVNWAMDKDFLGVIYDEKGGFKLSDGQIDRASAAMEKIMAKAIMDAELTLIQKWDLVEMVVAKLMEQGRLDENDFKILKAQWKTTHEGKAPVAQPVTKGCADLLVNSVRNAVEKPATPLTEDAPKE